MDRFNADHLLESLHTSFISRHHPSVNELMPSLLVNNYKREKKILTSIEEELKSCKSFDFSVAFINSEGIAAIKQTLDELALYSQAHPDGVIKGRILTTNYLNFTEPSALEELLDFPNIEVRAYTKEGFHPKGYIFEQSNYYSLIIGSANLTASALTMNQEWSIKFLSCTDGQIVYSVKEEFERIWNEADIVDSKWIDDYAKDYDDNKFKVIQHNDNSEIFEEFAPDDLTSYHLRTSEEQPEVVTETHHKEIVEEEIEIVPNIMQKEAMISLDELRTKGEKRGLLIAATGTGKTYLSIFDVKQMQPKKVLYVAHRDMILNKSAQSFKNILPGINVGFLTGKYKEVEADYLFASVFTLAKDEYLNLFPKDEFDYIIIDEVHHAGAESYKKIINYFEPKFLLGLTATPERTDGFDIFEMFHNNVPYEIRLHKAMEANLLCPFHYYGLSDFTVDGEVIDEKSDFAKLVSDERIKHIERAIQIYRNKRYPVKGLIFCSRIEEAFELAKKLTADGFISKCLTGENTDEQRERVIQELEDDNNPLQYIITVDIFNEGVDIPAINQVVMLRPTQSSIIFIQQLGRGLRKYQGKSYVSVIDFIGNYENNFFIPIALYGDNSYNKDNLRKTLRSGSACLPGASTVQITEIAKQRIFEAISKTNFSQLKLLKEEYTKLKMRLARIPSMMDFVDNGFIDPFLFIDYKGSYYLFKKTIEKEELDLSSEQICSLQFVSNEFARGVRLHELLILKLLTIHAEISYQTFEEALAAYNVKLTKKDFNGMLNLLSPDFYVQADKKKYGEVTYVEYDETAKKLCRSTQFNNLLESSVYKTELLDCLEYGIKRATLKPEEIVEDNNLVLYRKYSRKDICKLLNWKSDCSSTIYGYKTETSTEDYTCPIFVTYHKAADISETTKYEDGFIDNTRFSWMSRSRRTSEADEVAALIDQKQNNIKIMLFVKKDDGEGRDFYYLGKMYTNSFEDTTMKDKDGLDVSVVNIQFDMENPVPQNLYDYIEA